MTNNQTNKTVGNVHVQVGEHNIELTKLDKEVFDRTFKESDTSLTLDDISPETNVKNEKNYNALVFINVGKQTAIRFKGVLTISTTEGDLMTTEHVKNVTECMYALIAENVETVKLKDPAWKDIVMPQS